MNMFWGLYWAHVDAPHFYYDDGEKKYRSNQESLLFFNQSDEEMKLFSFLNNYLDIKIKLRFIFSSNFDVHLIQKKAFENCFPVDWYPWQWEMSSPKPEKKTVSAATMKSNRTRHILTAAINYKESSTSFNAFIHHSFRLDIVLTVDKSKKKSWNRFEHWTPSCVSHLKSHFLAHSISNGWIIARKTTFEHSRMHKLTQQLKRVNKSLRKFERRIYKAWKKVCNQRCIVDECGKCKITNGKSQTHAYTNVCHLTFCRASWEQSTANIFTLNDDWLPRLHSKCCSATVHFIQTKPNEMKWIKNKTEIHEFHGTEMKMRRGIKKIGKNIW